MLKDRLRAHPRSRGENDSQRAALDGPKGSSPLTRGKRDRGSAGPRAAGLIPAHAGKTPSTGCPRRWTQAHPRSRGENADAEALKQFITGSSPLTRGKRVDEQAANVRPGLIPAHAGKTSVMTMHGGASRAHPRSRGENWGGDACGVVAAGSSPLTRGKRSSLTDRQTPRPAHPRSRGENSTASGTVVRGTGSSPLTRGKLLQPCYSLVTGGLIPAHAGKTPAGRGGGAGARAHPRSRGENGGVHRLWRGEEGSSPLTRGKHADVPVDFILGGLILAHAGKTAGHGQAPCAAGAHPRSRGENKTGGMTLK